MTVNEGMCVECNQNVAEVHSDTCFHCKQFAVKEQSEKNKAHKRKSFISQIESHDPTSSAVAMKRAVLAILRGEV